MEKGLYSVFMQHITLMIGGVARYLEVELSI